MYQAELTPESKAPTTVSLLKTHVKTLLRHLKGRSTVASLNNLPSMQAYADARSAEKVARGIIMKELSSLRTIMAWAIKNGCMVGPIGFGKRDIRTPIEDKQHHEWMTYQQVISKLKRGGLGPGEESAIRKWVYRDDVQVVEVCEIVRSRSNRPWLFPMMAMAAATGARRKEMRESLFVDWDFENREVTIRDRKRVGGRRRRGRRQSTTFFTTSCGSGFPSAPIVPICSASGRVADFS
jgi:hypothetical protein